MKTKLLVAAGLLLAIGVSAADGRVIGEKKKGVKGRYLELEGVSDLGAYRGALVVLEPAEITSDKDKPVDTEAVRATSDDVLRETLQATGLFGSLLASAPLEPPEGKAILRLETALTLQHGSQAMRFFAGGGAGKSKLHIRIDISDAKTGQRLGHFNGYGTGAGLWSISGGGVQRMARDDLSESYTKLGEYLGEAMR